MKGTAIGVPVLVVAMTGIAQAQNAGGSAAASLSTKVTQRVIVVMQNQLSAVPDTAANAARRSAMARSTQSSVMAQMTQTHARNVKSLSLINAVVATVSPAAARQLAANPDVAQVVPDRVIPIEGTPPSVQAKLAKAAAGTKPLPGACAPGNKVQLNPEAIESIHAASQSGRGHTAQALGYTGAGVKVAYIADGIDPNNPDFIRANGQHVFIDSQDFSGTGTNAVTGGGEAFLDASSIAAQGREVYNIQQFGGFNRKCLIRVKGVAPGASLVGLNVFGSSNFAFNSVFLEAINYAVNTDHVNVLNESFGSNPFPDEASLDLTKMADEAAVKAGVTVVASSGDAGVTNTIGSPATDPAVLSAGATTTLRAYAQAGVAGITAPGVKGWISGNISAISSSGFDQAGGTMDVVAPGDLNWALCSPSPQFESCGGLNLELTGGTSESSPLTAGVAALVIQAYAKSHGGQDPSPAIVKKIIVSTAQDINAPGELQGAGMDNAYQAVLAAKNFKGSSGRRTGHAIINNKTQLTGIGQAGSKQKFSEKLTNTGRGPLTVHLSSRTLAPYQVTTKETVGLNSGNGFAEAVPFTVPGGQARLNVSVSLPGVIDLSLISPGHKLAMFNLPQGVGNFGNAQVAKPQPGVWTALISTRPGSSPVSAQFQAETAGWQDFGKLSTNRLRLPAGGSKKFTFKVRTPALPGDQAGSIVMKSSAAVPAFSRVTTVPVTLRSLVPTPNPSTTFTGTLTGGNGRSTTTGQTAYYQVQVPSGTKALNVDVSTANPANTMLAQLVDPSTGMGASTAFNGMLVTTASGGTGFKPQTGAQLHVLNPSAGTWTLVVDFFNSVSGTSVAQPFTVTMNDTPVTASASGLPDSASTQLAAGTPVTVPVTVTNNGTTPEEYFVDPRLSTQSTDTLAAQTTNNLTLPNLAGTIPTYLVPSHTSAISAQVTTSPTPAFFDINWTFGDPDLASNTGTTSTANFSSSAVAPGDWTVTPFLQGPTGPNQAPSQPATASMTATHAAFDPAVTSPTGDLWLGSLDPNSLFTPVVVGAGQTATVNVTITPSGSSGTVVSGTLYVAAASFLPGAVTINVLPNNAPEGSDVAAFPYTYTIK
ncbi:MAG TPA: protease inhibitor I9 family protein [Streptosporangiaceae bacterium]